MSRLKTSVAAWLETPEDKTILDGMYPKAVPEIFQFRPRLAQSHTKGKFYLRVKMLAWLFLFLASPALASDNFKCIHPPYRVHKVSSSPLILYLDNFITPQERTHLKEVSAPRFRRSVIAGQDGAQKSSLRTSQSTDIPRDAVVQCIEQRALDFQGFDTRSTQLEPLQLVRYTAGEHYDFHTDWLSDPRYVTSFNGGNRLSSFFVYVYVSDNTTGGGTNFPHVSPPNPKSERWCRFVDCDEPYARGTTFRPVEGNAIFWENLLGRRGEKRQGDGRTEHAGLPLTTGHKIGLNIWTRQAGVSEAVRREGGPLDF